MRVVQLTAVALLIVGVTAAVLTIWQIIDTSAQEPELSGPAPVLIGDAPPPATSTPSATIEPETAPTSTPASSDTPVPSPPPVAPTATLSTRNLAPATMPATSTRQREGATPAAPTSIEGNARGSSRQTSSPHAVPAYVRIPRIEIEPLVVPVGLNERGEMASPADFFQVGWWQLGAIPGDYGRAVMAGHVDTPDGAAIFYGIDQLEPGDEIFVGSSEAGQPELRFVVTGAALYHVDHAPVDQIFGASTKQELILITCGGSFDHDTGQYLYRRVVFARLAP